MYNEEERIADTLEKINNYLIDNNYNYNIIVVDDGSTDNSYNVALNYIHNSHNDRVFICRNQANRGKGFSVKRGLIIGDSDYYLFTDCDLSCSINQLEKLMKHIENNDLIIGSRYVKGGVVATKQSLLRRFYSRAFNLLVNCLFKLGVKDAQCGFKLYSRKLRDLIVDRSFINGFAFDVEHLVICRENGLNYKECGIVWNNLKVQKFKIMKIIDMFFDIMRILKNKKKYGVK